ncbi:poly-gamma-glutamate synthase PgsB [Fusibacter sp. 3D3]|uniref:poly-gamma-glutamate synthase PgsB n=1 Tax=Fusibacter sp. 3D3 TaxID=1048380 RepID=UPI00085897AF|nr:poly-gamma-glutamate synthase PgsB [Fusibacter sp. 3D3]GAU76125.1 poly-gamma-glutamate synthase subunit PgsB/CapB [Fusibacter sp. 3D3]
MLEKWIIFLFALTIIGFIIENKLAINRRKQFKHVIYINGTRGKSTVTRLIDAGLRQGGYRVFCKTTGTVPLTIGTDNVERRIKRNGKPNIKEQLWVLKKAQREKADILVCECMAISPELQCISQDRMVRSDIGVITNVRHDHMEEMGKTLPEICDALSSTIPEHGVLFTSDVNFYDQLKQNAKKRHTEVILANLQNEFEHEHFRENMVLALSVCEHVGVAKEVAMEGMQHYKKDPYALSLFLLESGGVFVNGFSINDPDSTMAVYDKLTKSALLKHRKCILLINSRADRLSRTQQMIELAIQLKPSEVWLIGSMKAMARRTLEKKGMDVKVFNASSTIDFKTIDAHFFVFAVGNIAHEGVQLMRKIEMEGREIG